jgi:PIN domain nuclease of toxin-antitoxin system
VTAPLLDTHAWVWWVDRDSRLGRRTLDHLDALPAEDRPVISAISLWEVATLVERGRLRFRLPFDVWIDAAAHPRTVRVHDITPAVAVELTKLPDTFHRDPADRVIVATCRAERLSILTHDRPIRRSRLVKLWSPRVSA